MARKFLTDIDLAKNSLNNAAIQNLASDPSSPVTGQIYFNTADGKLKQYNGSTWIEYSTATSSGDASTNTATSVDSEIALFSGTGGKTLKRATGSGIVKATSGVMSTVTAPSGTIVGDTDTQTLSAKTLTTPTIASFTNATHDHTNSAGGGTLTHSAVSDFDTQVRTSRLDQMAAPTADVSANSHKITNVTDPTSAQDAATKAYVDSTSAGIDWKASVRAASTANGTLASAFANGSVIDGVTLATGDRILLKDQSTGSQNGIYVVAASGAPSRATDADANAEVTGGLAVFVEEGTANADTGWVMTNDGAVTIGSTALTFTQFTGLGEVTAGTGISKSGNTVSVASAYAGNGIGTVNGLAKGNGSGTISAATEGTDYWKPGGTDVAVADGGTGSSTAAGARTNLGATTKYTATIGDGSTTAIAITHSLGTKDVIVQLRQASDDAVVEADIVQTSTSVTTVTFAVAPASNAIKAVIIG